MAVCLMPLVLMALGYSTTTWAAAPALQGYATLRPLTPTEIKAYSLTGIQGASGLNTVGVGQPFYLEAIVNAAIAPSNIISVTWTLTAKPLDSMATLLPSPLGTAIPTYKTYDYWAIEYAYKPIAAGDEAAELRRIAARSSEPQFAYGTDEDNLLGLDPESLQFDLGDDVVAFARKRIAIAQELLARQETRVLTPDEDYAVLRRSVLYAVRDVGRASNALTRQIGGVRTLRDAPGSGRDPLTPVAVDQQREALDLIALGLLSADSLKVSPALQRKLGADYLERWDAVRGGDAAAGTDFSLAVVVLDLQKGMLATLMSDAVAARLLDSAEKAPSGPQRALRLAELDARLTQAVWSELATGGDIPSLRRELQRDHVNRLANQLLRPQSQTRADVRSLRRMQAKALAKQLEAAARRGGLNEATRAHLDDSADTLNQALAAKLERQGV